MSAERGQAKLVLLVAVCLLTAAIAAWFVMAKMRDRGPADAEQTAMVTEPVSHEPAQAPAVTDTAEPMAAAPAPVPAARSAQTLPRLLDLGSGTCVPCKMMAPILDEMKETFAGELTVEFIDVRTDKAAAKQYGIQVIPTQIFFDASGNEVFRHQGFYSREDMLAKWKELGVELDG